MTQYAGLCIGGPLDGQALAAQTTQHRVEERPSIGKLTAVHPGGVERELGTVRMSLKSVSYRWHPLPGMGIWVPEGVTVEQAVSDMATLYANTVNR
jgi:hypothetical protein